MITEAFGLPNRFVIHVLGPRYGIDEPAEDLLAACHEGAVVLADEHELSSIAFPAVSSGAFGYPVAEAAPVALAAAQRALSGARHVRSVRFVLYGHDERQAFERAWPELRSAQR